MSRMLELKQISAGEPGTFPMADIRVRVDMDAIARFLAKKAMTARSHRAGAMGGAIVVESFNVLKAAPEPKQAAEAPHDGNRRPDVRLLCGWRARRIVEEPWPKAKSAGKSYVLINPKEPLEAQRPPGLVDPLPEEAAPAPDGWCGDLRAYEDARFHIQPRVGEALRSAIHPTGALLIWPEYD